MIIYFAELYPGIGTDKALLHVSSKFLKDKFISTHQLLKLRKRVRKMSNEFHSSLNSG